MSSEDFRNVILAIALSMGVYVVYQTLFVAPAVEEQRREQAAAGATAQPQPSEPGSPLPRPSESGSTLPQPTEESGSLLPQPDNAGVKGGTAAAAPAAAPVTRADALARSARIPIRSGALDGSIALTGAKIDHLQLSRYRETPDKNSDVITLLAPEAAKSGYAAKHGWLAGGSAQIKTPTENTVWTQVGSNPLSPGKPVTLQWDNGEGLLFTRTISVDKDYMFTISQRVANSGETTAILYPYGLLTRYDPPDGESLGFVHLGLIGAFEGELKNMSYDALSKREGKEFSQKTGAGWVGFTDKYWLTALVPAKDDTITGRFLARKSGGRDIFQADYLLEGRTIAPGTAAEVTTRLYAGAKKAHLLETYEKQYGITNFSNAIDWGWFSFLSKPFFMVLDWINKIVGNFGITILIFTVLVKLVFFWPSQKSYQSMAKMKKVQPEMKRLQERYKSDKPKLQQEMLELYKKEKINPVAGCLPILIQFPVFIALYQVLFVTIEMRHAPFFGWIRDLSAPDPTTVFNLFGLLPYDPTQVPMIGSLLGLGVWPLLMGISMWFQMKMNPPPPDPVQARIFGLMPLIFMFILAGFAAGLVIYWAWNNILSIGQQYVIMRRMGVEPEWKNNLRLPGAVRRLFNGGKPEADAGDRPGAVAQTTREKPAKEEG